MKKLKILLITLFAAAMSLCLFACGGGKKAPGAIVSVTVSNQIQLTETQTKEDFKKELSKLEVTVVYDDEDATTKTLTTKEWEVKDEEIEKIQFGTIGTYSFNVQPTDKAGNENDEVGTGTVVIDHAWEPVEGEEGKFMCAGEDHATKTEKTINDVAQIAGWHEGMTVTNGTGAKQVESVYNGATSTVGRLDKGMTITLIGKGETLVKNAATYYYPVLGIGNFEENGSILQRNDNWSIYDAMTGGPTAWARGNQDAKNGSGNEWPGYETAEEMIVYVEGDISDSSAFDVETDIQLTWSYDENCVATMTWYYPALGRLRTARVKLPERQFYNAILHGEQMKMTFTKAIVQQNLNLEEIESVGAVQGQKTDYIENEYLDFNAISVMTKYEQYDSAVRADAFDIYASTKEGVTDVNDAEANWIDLSKEKLSTSMKSFKAVVAAGDQSDEKIFTANADGGIFTITANAVDNAVANDVAKGNQTFTATQLSGIDFGQKVDGTTYSKQPVLTVNGAAATMDEAHKTALGTGITASHYIAFSVYANGTTKFTANAEGTITGTKGYAKVNADGTQVDIILAIDETVVKTTKNVTITGLQTATVNVNLENVSSFTYTSTVTQTKAITLNGGGEIHIVYNLKSGELINKDNAGDYTIGYGSVTTALSTFFRAPGGRVVGTGNLDPTAAEHTNEATRNVGSNGVTVTVKTPTAGTLDVTYHIPASVTNIANYNFVLLANKTLEVSDVVYPAFELTSQEGDRGVMIDDYYVQAEGARLIIVTGKAYPRMVTSYNAIRGSLSIQINAGKNTPVLRSDFIGKHDLSYVVGADGTVTFTNVKVNGLVSGRFVTYGTLDDNRDTDRGAFLVIEIDITKLGYEANDEYTFEFNPTGNTGTYYNVKLHTEGEDTSYMIIEDGVQFTAQDTPTTLIEGNCATPTLQSHDVKSGADAFYYANITNAYTGEHTWSTTADETTGLYSCTQCGSVRNFNDKEVAAEGLTITGLQGEKENLVESGMTVMFDVRSIQNPDGTTASADWGSQILATAQGNVLITLPNLDPWNNTVADIADATEREKELAGKVAGANAFPNSVGSNDLFNGGAWDTFLAKESGYGAITISTQTGVSYYFEGVLKVRYAADRAIGSATVAEFAELFLSLVGHYGVIVNNSGAPVANVSVIKGAYDDAKVLAEYTAYTAHKPTAPEPEEETAGAMLMSLRPDSQIPSADHNVTIGDTGFTLGYTGTTPTWVGTIQAGEVITLSGTMTSKAESNWHCPILNVFSDDSGWHAGLRGDNWTGVASTNVTAFNPSTADSKFDPDAEAEGDDAAKWWAAARKIFANCTVEFTFDATNVIMGDVCGGYFSMTFKATKTGAPDQVYVCTATFELADNWSWWHDTGVQWDGMQIGIGGEACCIVLNSYEKA